MNNVLNPIQFEGKIFLKRNDLFTLAGCNGGKTASANLLIQEGIKAGYNSFITCGSRFSPTM